MSKRTENKFQREFPSFNSCKEYKIDLQTDEFYYREEFVLRNAIDKQKVRDAILSTCRYRKEIDILFEKLGLLKDEVHTLQRKRQEGKMTTKIPNTFADKFKDFCDFTETNFLTAYPKIMLVNYYKKKKELLG